VKQSGKFCKVLYLLNVKKQSRYQSVTALLVTVITGFSGTVSVKD
jgi:hypothetical protein